MRKLAVISAFAVMTTFGANAQEARILSGPELKKAVGGRTIFVSTPLGEVPIRLHNNGTMVGASQLALLDGEETPRDRGRWWIASNKLCLKWQNWMQRRTYCFVMQKLGNRVRWVRNDGKTGTARLG